MRCTSCSDRKVNGYFILLFIFIFYFCSFIISVSLSLLSLSLSFDIRYRRIGHAGVFPGKERCPCTYAILEESSGWCIMYRDVRGAGEKDGEREGGREKKRTFPKAERTP